MKNVLEQNAKVKDTGSVVNMAEDCYESHMVTYKWSPFVYGKGNGEKIHSGVASLTLFNCEGQELVVSNLTNKNEIKMDIPLQNNKEHESVRVEHTLHRHRMNIHQFNMTSEHQSQSLHIVIHLKPILRGRVFSVALLLSEDSPPTPDHYILRQEFQASENTLKFYLPPDSLKNGSIYHLGIVDALFNAGRPRKGEVHQRVYTLQLWWGECLFWDEKYGDWSSRGCVMDKTSTLSKAHCSCSHLTSFAISSQLAPNDLSFKNVDDFFNLNENPVTFSFILALLTLYALLMLVAIKLDRHDARKGTVVLLVDNRTTDLHTYLVTLETGFRRGAGTSAKVSMILHGEYGMSETRELLSESGQPLFERNSRDVFIVTLANTLGPIWKIQLWHNNAGPSPSWYLSRVTVKDVNNDRHYHFSCEKWFAVEENDGKIEREIMATEGGLGFTKVLWAKGTQYVTDFHLWLSTFSRPPVSRFTRAQRLTCCLTLLLSYMAVNAAWYKTGEEEEYRGEFGLVDLSWRALVVGVITSLIVLPPNFLIVLMFRRSKIHRVRLEDPPNMKHKPVKRDSVSSISSTALLLQPAVTPSIFDQSMLNWAALQEWAQKQWAKRYGPQSVNSSLPDVKPPVIQEIKDPKSPESATDNNAIIETMHVDHNAEPEEQGDVAQQQQDEQEQNVRNNTEPQGNDGISATQNTDEPSINSETPANNRNNQNTSQNQNEADHQNEAAVVDNPSRSSASESSNDSSHSNPRTMSTTLNRRDRNEIHIHHALQKLKNEMNHRGKRSSSEASSKMEEAQQAEMHERLMESLRSRKPMRCFLPSWFRVVAWVLCFLICCGCAAVTILYGFRFGRTKSIMWLQSLFFSFLQCVFITHPIVVLLVTLYTAIRYRHDMSIFDHHSDGILQLDEMKLAVKDGNEGDDVDLAEGIAARQRSRYLRFARPPQEKQLIMARKKTMKEKKAMGVLNEVVSFSILFILVVFVAFGKSTTEKFRLNESLKTILARDGHTPFTSVETAGDWWRWSQTHLMDVLYFDKWYNDQPTGFDMGLIANSALIGRVSLRQVRVAEHDCSTAKTYPDILKCRYQYDRSHRDDQPYGLNHSWPHVSESYTRAHTLQGKHAQYTGDGYQILLESTRNETLLQLSELQQQGWIDLRTRAVIVEFILFHPPTNLFSAVKLLLEMPPTGRAFPSVHVTSTHLYKYTSRFDNFVLACELLLIFVTLVKCHHEVDEALRWQKDYIKNPWNCVEVALLILLVSYIACYVYRFVLISETIELLRATYHEEFVDITFVAFWDQMLQSFMGFILFMSMLQSLHLLRNRPVFARLGGVYRQAATEIFHFLGLFLVWLLAYTSLGVALFHALSLEFSSFNLGLGTVSGLMTGFYNLDDLERADPTGCRLYIVSFLIFSVGSLTAYIIAVLTFHLRVYREHGLPSLSILQALQVFSRNLLISLGIKSLRSQNEEQDNMLPPEFTMAEIEYQVDEMLFKMNALTGSSGLPEKPPTYFTDSDCTYGTGEDAISSGGSEMHGFDDDRFERHIYKIENQLRSNEPHLAQLLHLETINNDSFTKDKEKQLRSQLEMQIFRQLQMQRQDVRGGPPMWSHAAMRRRLSSGSTSGPISATTSRSSSHGSADCSPASAGSNKNHLHFNFPKLNPQGRETDAPTSRMLSDVVRQKIPKPRLLNEVLVLQDLSEQGSSGHEDNMIQMKDLQKKAVNDDKNSERSSTSSGKSGQAETKLGEEGNSGEDPVSTSSCSSGGAEVAKVMKQGQVRGQGQVPAAGGDSGKQVLSETGAVPKVLKPGRYKAVSASSEKLTKFDCLNDSSSLSDIETLAKATKARSLRKTKSRGKGKGRKGLSPVEGFDELGIDNKGYSSDSDHEGKDVASFPRPKQKQCWT